MVYCRNKSRSLQVVVVAAGLQISILAALLSGQEVEPAGIQRMTLESQAEAIECGKAGADCAITPYRLCPSENGRQYTAWIATPFSRVASYVFEMQKRKERLRPMTPGAANGWGVGIYVSPSEDPDNAGSIERVVIKRAGETIEPITTTIAPVIFTGPRGEKKQLSKGFFAFPMNAFAPTSDITIVLISAAGEVACPLDRRKLSILR